MIWSRFRFEIIATGSIAGARLNRKRAATGSRNKPKLISSFRSAAPMHFSSGVDT
jgi:hypothetical protein